MPLHTDYRPRSFDEVIGNKATIDSLKSVLARKDRFHAYLFQGPSGCGKTTLARILAKELGCALEEFHEYDTSNVRGIADIQEIKVKSMYSPLVGNIRVNFFDEVHEITKHGAEAMLKFLEDTPSHVYNILSTTNPEKIIKTIKTRCAIYTVSSLTSIDIRKLLKWVAESEGMNLTEKVQSSLTLASEGCPRKLLVMLDQIVDIHGEADQLEAINKATYEGAEIIDICRLILERGKPETKWPKIAKTLETFDQDPENTRRAILGYLSRVLLECKGEDGKRTALLLSEFQNNYYDSGKSGLIVGCFMACLV